MAGPRSDRVQEEQMLVRALRDRDEAAFSELLDRYFPAMVRLAMTHVGSRARAEEVVQETWLAVLRGIDRFEGRSSVRTWIFRILLNRAKTYATRESRLVPFSSLDDRGHAEDGLRAPAASSRGGRSRGTPWLPYAEAWEMADNPDDWILAEELRVRIERAIQSLPPSQREVITLRDLGGWSASEVCNALEISETNQRVLLHRARIRVRDALEPYFAEPDDRTDPQALGV